MAEDDILELLWQNGQIVRRSQTQTPTSDKLSLPHPPPRILHGSGSGGREGNVPPVPPFLPQHHQNLFIQEDELASWLQYQIFCSGPLYSCVASTPATHPQIPVSLAPSPPPPPPPPPIRATYDKQAARRVDNFMSLFTRGRVEAGPRIPLVREPMQVGSSVIPSSSATGSSVTPSTIIGRVSHSFTAPGLGLKGKEVVREPMQVGSSSIPLYSTTGSFVTPSTAIGGVSHTFEVLGLGLKDKEVVREPMQVGSRTIPLTSATGSYTTPSTVIGGVSHTFAVPGLGRKDKEVAREPMQFGSSAFPLTSATAFSATPWTSIGGVSHTFEVLGLGRKDKEVVREPMQLGSSAIPLSSKPGSYLTPWTAIGGVSHTSAVLGLGLKDKEVVREPMHLGSSTIPLSSATGSYLTPSTAIGGVSHTFAVPGLGRKDKAAAVETVCEIAGISSSGTEPIHTQPAMETDTDVVEKTREARGSRARKRSRAAETHNLSERETREARGSRARKRSRAAETHNLSERKRREKVNEMMKCLQEITPGCSKTNKVLMLEDAVDHVKWLRKQLKVIYRRGGLMPPMYQANMQRWFMPHTAMRMMGMNQPPFIPFPRQDHMAGAGPSHPVPPHRFPYNQASDPSRAHFLSQQPSPVSNQPQFPAPMHPYTQSVGLHQMQQPPPTQNQTASQLSSSQASCSKGPDDQEPTG